MPPRMDNVLVWEYIRKMFEGGPGKRPEQSLSVHKGPKAQIPQTRTGDKASVRCFLLCISLSPLSPLGQSSSSGLGWLHLGVPEWAPHHIHIAGSPGFCSLATNCIYLHITVSHYSTIPKQLGLLNKITVKFTHWQCSGDYLGVPGSILGMATCKTSIPKGCALSWATHGWPFHLKLLSVFLHTVFLIFSLNFRDFCVSGWYISFEGGSKQ